MRRALAFLLVCLLLTSCGRKVTITSKGSDPENDPGGSSEPPDGPTKTKPPARPEWPTLRGADRTGVSREGKLLQAWPKGGPPAVWRATNLGEGFGTVSIAGGRGFVVGFQGIDEVLFALDLKDGKHVWEASLGTAARVDHPGARCTPTVDGNRVYALTVGGDLTCVNAQNGKLQWRRSLPRDFGGRAGGWGYAESPLIDGDRVICTPGGPKATLVALNKETGTTVWESAVPGSNGAGYASAIIAEAGDTRMYVQFIAGGVIGVRADDGQFLWRYDKPSNGTANCSAPIDMGGGRIFAASGYSTGAGMVEVSPKSKSADTREVFFSKAMQNQHGGVVHINGYFYGAHDPNFLSCIDAKSGKMQWQDRKPGKGAITAADGHLIYREEHSGSVMLIEASPVGYREHGRFKVDRNGGSAAWAYPVVCDGRLYIRDWHTLYCHDIKAK